MYRQRFLTLLGAAVLVLSPWAVMLAQSVGGSCTLPLPDSAYWISSRYGPRIHPLAGVPRKHLGVDLACPTGTAVHAAADGVVTYAGRWGCYGRVVILRHPGDVVTLYAHLSRIAPGLRPGEPVCKGQVIALSGASGCVTGSHLHFEVWEAGQRINPLLVCARYVPTLKRSAQEVD